MKVFHYTQSTSIAGKDQLPALIICVALFTWFAVRWLNDKSKPLDTSDYLIIIVFIGALIGAGFSVLKRVQSSGNWDISIDDKTIQWNAPDGFEKSFLVNLDQISAFDIHYHLTTNNTEFNLNMLDGRNFNLNEDSGINLEKFADALTSQGVKINRIEDVDN